VRWDERLVRPCAYSGAPDNGMWIPERGPGDTGGMLLGDTDGISVTQKAEDKFVCAVVAVACQHTMVNMS